MAYAARMTGILSLYLSIIYVAPLDPNVPPQFRPAAAWKLLIHLFTIPLVSLEPTPQLIEAVLSVCGSKLQSLYGAQWRKLWVCLREEGLVQGKAGFNPKETGWAKASVAKLGLLLDDWAAQGIKEAEGSRVDP